jgi:hypothetical protein
MVPQRTSSQFHRFCRGNLEITKPITMFICCSSAPIRTFKIISRFGTSTRASFHHWLDEDRADEGVVEEDEFPESARQPKMIFPQNER